MIIYPVSFNGESSATSGIMPDWKTAASDLSLRCAVPKEFDGPGGELSPEDFFLLALQNCFVATFKVYAHYSKLKFSTIESKAELIVDKDSAGRPVMKELKLQA